MRQGRGILLLHPCCRHARLIGGKVFPFGALEEDHSPIACCSAEDDAIYALISSAALFLSFLAVGRGNRACGGRRGLYHCHSLPPPPGIFLPLASFLHKGPRGRRRAGAVALAFGAVCA